MEQNENPAVPEPGVPPPPPPPSDPGAPPPPPPPGGNPITAGLTSGPPPPPSGAAFSSNERLYATFIHLSPLLVAVIVIAAHLPVLFLGFLAPLIMWLIKKDESVFIDDQGKEALNFTITVGILELICIPLMFILIGIPLIIALVIYAAVMAIIAALQANKGIYYRYPYCLRLIK